MPIQDRLSPAQNGGTCFLKNGRRDPFYPGKREFGRKIWQILDGTQKVDMQRTPSIPLYANTSSYIYKRLDHATPSPNNHTDTRHNTSLAKTEPPQLMQPITHVQQYHHRHPFRSPHKSSPPDDRRQTFCPSLTRSTLAPRPCFCSVVDLRHV
jgi:hypothetical protein